MRALRVLSKKTSRSNIIVHDTQLIPVKVGDLADLQLLETSSPKSLQIIHFLSTLFLTLETYLTS